MEFGEYIKGEKGQISWGKLGIRNKVFGFLFNSNMGISFIVYTCKLLFNIFFGTKNFCSVWHKIRNGKV